MLRVTSPRLFLWIHQGLKFPLPKIQTPQYLLGRQGLILQQLQHQGVMLTPTPLRGAAEQDAKILAMGKNLRQGDIAHPRRLEKKKKSNK